MIYADTETHVFTDDEPIPRLVVNAFASASGDARLVLRDDLAPSQLEAILAQRLVLCGGSFDLLVWLRAYPSIWPALCDALAAGRIHDVQLREKMLDHAYGARNEASRYDLGTIARVRAGQVVDKSDAYRKLYGGLDGTPLHLWPEGARTYALRDAQVLVPIFAEQQKHADLLTDEPRQVRAAFALASMQARGFRVDRSRVSTLDRLFDEVRIEHEQALVRVGLARPKHKIKRPSPLVKSQKKARELIVQLAADTGQAYVRTDKGSPALSAEALEALHVPEGHPLRHYRDLNSLVSKRNTYLRPMLGVHEVRGTYDPCVETGRTSMFDPNLQNLPRDVLQWIPAERLPEVSPGVMLDLSPIKPRPLGFRECLVPREGCCFVIADWGMMELVCLAQTCLDWFGWSKLAEALQQGRDPHEELGSTIAGHDIRGTPERKLYRTLAKAPNFGYPGGLGAERFVAWAGAAYGEALREGGLVIDVPFARALKEHWRTQWPEMVLYHKRIGRLTRSGLATMRLDRTGYVRGGMKFTDASNFPFQAEAAAVKKDAIFVAEAETRHGRLAGVLLHEVHDELILEAPIDVAIEAAHGLERIMLGCLARVCPDVPGSVETMLTNCYTK